MVGWLRRRRARIARDDPARRLRLLESKEFAACLARAPYETFCEQGYEGMAQILCRHGGSFGGALVAEAGFLPIADAEAWIAERQISMEEGRIPVPDDVAPVAPRPAPTLAELEAAIERRAAWDRLRRGHRWRVRLKAFALSPSEAAALFKNSRVTIRRPDTAAGAGGFWQAMSDTPPWFYFADSGAAAESRLTRAVARYELALSEARRLGFDPLAYRDFTLP
jgi:hypothetical protein